MTSFPHSTKQLQEGVWRREGSKPCNQLGFAPRSLCRPLGALRRLAGAARGAPGAGAAGRGGDAGGAGAGGAAVGGGGESEAQLLGVLGRMGMGKFVIGDGTCMVKLTKGMFASEVH